MRVARPWQDGSWQPLDLTLCVPVGQVMLREAPQAPPGWSDFHWSWAAWHSLMHSGAYFAPESQSHLSQ